MTVLGVKELYLAGVEKERQRNPENNEYGYLAAGIQHIIETRGNVKFDCPWEVTSFWHNGLVSCSLKMTYPDVLRHLCAMMWYDRPVKDDERDYLPSYYGKSNVHTHIYELDDDSAAKTEERAKAIFDEQVKRAFPKIRRKSKEYNAKWEDKKEMALKMANEERERRKEHLRKEIRDYQQSALKKLAESESRLKAMVQHREWYLLLEPADDLKAFVEKQLASYRPMLDRVLKEIDETKKLLPEQVPA